MTFEKITGDQNKEKPYGISIAIIKIKWEPFIISLINGRPDYAI